MLQSNGGAQPFIIFAIDKNFKKYYCVMLAKSMKFVVFVKKCFECKKLGKIRERLNEASFFKKKPDLPYQQTLWKVFLFTFRDNIHFRVKILAVKKSW